MATGLAQDADRLRAHKQVFAVTGDAENGRFCLFDLLLGGVIDRRSLLGGQQPFNGSDHASGSLNSTMSDCCASSRRRAARPLFERALAIYETALGLLIEYIERVPKI
jgi:hypothetical protein